MESQPSARYAPTHLPDIPERTLDQKSLNGPAGAHEWPSIRPQSAHFFETAVEPAMSPPMEQKPIETAPPPEEPKDPPKLLIASLFLSVFLSALDITIITTALPTMAETLHTNATGFGWIGSAYLLAGAASGPVWAKISDIFGRKPVMLAANIFFLIGSAVCGWSFSLGMLIAGRVVQGIGSGGLLVMVSILLSDLFSAKRRGKYSGLLGTVWGVANGLGPAIGGLFCEKLNWRWCFWINIPLDGIAFLAICFFLKVHKPHTPLVQGLLAIDWLGAIAIVGGTVMLLLGLDFGGITFPWTSPIVLSLLLVGIATLAAAILIEATIPRYPIIPLHIFRSLSNSVIYAINFSHGFVFIAGSYFLPIYFQAVLGTTPLLSGVYLFPYNLTLSITSIITGMTISKHGAYKTWIIFSLLLLALGFLLFAEFPPHTSWPRLVLYQLIAGCGVGPLFQAPMIAMQNSVAAQDRAAATSMFSFVRQIANAISVVLGNVVLQNQLAGKRAQLLASGTAPPLVHLLTHGHAVSSPSAIAALLPEQKIAVRAALTDALGKMWLMYAVVAVLGLALPSFIKNKKLSDQHVVHETGL
ncbi:putative efflux pump antibiotic resistance protein, partial [Trichodelitschia bisporula]